MYDQGRGDLLDFLGDNLFFDTCLYGQRGLQLLVDTIPARNLLFASEMIGAVTSKDPATGRRYDDTRALLDAADHLGEADRAAIASGNARRVFPRVNEILEASQAGTAYGRGAQL